MQHNRLESWHKAETEKVKGDHAFAFQIVKKLMFIFNKNTFQNKCKIHKTLIGGKKKTKSALDSVLLPSNQDK